MNNIRENSFSSLSLFEELWQNDLLYLPRDVDDLVSDTTANRADKRETLLIYFHFVVARACILFFRQQPTEWHEWHYLSDLLRHDSRNVGYDAAAHGHRVRLRTRIGVSKTSIREEMSQLIDAVLNQNEILDQNALNMQFRRLCIRFVGQPLNNHELRLWKLRVLGRFHEGEGDEEDAAAAIPMYPPIPQLPNALDLTRANLLEDYDHSYAQWVFRFATPERRAQILGNLLALNSGINTFAPAVVGVTLIISYLSFAESDIVRIPPRPSLSDHQDTSSKFYHYLTVDPVRSRSVFSAWMFYACVFFVFMKGKMFLERNVSWSVKIVAYVSSLIAVCSLIIVNAAKPSISPFSILAGSLLLQCYSWIFRYYKRRYDEIELRIPSEILSALLVAMVSFFVVSYFSAGPIEFGPSKMRYVDHYATEERDVADELCPRNFTALFVNSSANSLDHVVVPGRCPGYHCDCESEAEIFGTKKVTISPYFMTIEAMDRFESLWTELLKCPYGHTFRWLKTPCPSFVSFVEEMDSKASIDTSYYFFQRNLNSLMVHWFRVQCSETDAWSLVFQCKDGEKIDSGDTWEVITANVEDLTRSNSTPATIRRRDYEYHRMHVSENFKVMVQEDNETHCVPFEITSLFTCLSMALDSRGIRVEERFGMDLHELFRSAGVYVDPKGRKTFYMLLEGSSLLGSDSGTFQYIGKYSKPGPTIINDLLDQNFAVIVIHSSLTEVGVITACLCTSTGTATISVICPEFPSITTMNSSDIFAAMAFQIGW